MRFLALLVFLLAVRSLSAAIINAASVERDDVQAAISASTSGDTVDIPAGVAIWTNGITTSKGITIQGAGRYVHAGNGVISNENAGETIIIDQIANRQVPVWTLTWTSTTGMQRLTGLQIRGTNTSDAQFGVVFQKGSINLQGTNNSQWRIDHNYFNAIKGRPINVYAFAGLIDNNYFNQAGAPAIAFDGRVPDSNQQGHWSWATDVLMGTVHEGVYIENCFFSNTTLRAVTDGFAGSRIVFRYNTVVNGAVENHGTDSTGIYRGGRWIASYNNTLSTTISGESAHHYRSGSGVIFSNTVSGSFPGVFRGLNYRSRDKWSPYGGHSGTNVWDQNDETLFASGSHTGTNNATVLIDTNASWTVNQWNGYAFLNENTLRFGQCYSNTVSAAWFYDSAFSNPLLWTNGQSYLVHKVIRSLDGVGMGKGDLLTRVSGTEVTPVGWPNQVDEPIYIWNNAGTTGMSNSGDDTIVNGRNYTNAVHPTYVALIFPHPFNTDDPTPPAPSRLHVGGRATVTGELRTQ